MAAMATLANSLAGATGAVAALPTGSSALPARAQTQLRMSARRVNGASRFVVRAADSEGLGSAADAGGNSVVLEVMALPEEPDTEGIGNAAPKTRKPSPLQKGGSLFDERKDGKAPAAATLGKASPLSTIGAFDDPRWKNGTWDISMFTQDGKTNWDAVIDAGMKITLTKPPLAISETICQCLVSFFLLKNYTWGYMLVAFRVCQDCFTVRSRNRYLSRGFCMYS